MEIFKSFGLDMVKGCPVLLMIMGICFLLPFRLRKPALIGKISMVIAGGAAMAAVVFMGLDI